ncbi:hypothetical protein OH76DRAFT_70435 [Lentinus brumalis]|uniref:Uncharacterized protein n=1 Tax=Lentinus brumalis TaxID=2498619 RepID=A0A371DKR4_9APHY|nr:hypothetical protein OH76DRAFT_70435 [Polyporus brumalis]
MDKPKVRHLHTVAVSERRLTPRLEPIATAFLRVEARTRTYTNSPSTPSTQRVHRTPSGIHAPATDPQQDPQNPREPGRADAQSLLDVRQRSPAHAQRRSVRKPKFVIYTRAPRPREYAWQAREGFCRLRIPGDVWMNGRYEGASTGAIGDAGLLELPRSAMTLMRECSESDCRLHARPRGIGRVGRGETPARCTVQDVLRGLCVMIRAGWFEVRRSTEHRISIEDVSAG